MIEIPVSAIIPTYNRATFLTQAIDSILSGSMVPAQIIVLDDGSTDATADTVECYGARVHYARQDNAGKSVALNRALDLVDQPFVWIMDDDDLARPHGLAALFAALSDDPDAGFAHGRYDVFSNGTTVERRAPLIPHPGAETFHLGELYGCSVLQPAMLVRRDCYVAVGPFDPTLVRSQDYDMLLRLARRYRGVAIDDIIFDQRQHDAARGTAELQRTRASSIALWRHYGQRIFRHIHDQYDLDEYLPGDARTDPAARHRALVRRAGFMGRRGLWKLALADLELAGNCDRQALMPSDVAVFRAALFPRTPSTEPVPLRAVIGAIRSFEPASRRLLTDAAIQSRRALWRSRIRYAVAIGLKVSRFDRLPARRRTPHRASRS